MKQFFRPVIEGESIFKLGNVLEFVHDDGMFIEFNGKKAVEIRATEVEPYPNGFEVGCLGYEITRGCGVESEEHDLESVTIIRTNLFRIIEDQSEGKLFENDCEHLNKAFLKIFDPTVTKEEFKSFIGNGYLADMLDCQVDWNGYFGGIPDFCSREYATKVKMKVIEANLPDFKSFLGGKFVYGGETIAEVSE